MTWPKLVLIGVAAGGLLYLGSSSAESDWQRLSNSSATAAEYDKFLRSWPNSRYAPEARRRVEEDNRWKAAERTSDPLVLQQYLEQYPASAHAEEALRRLEDLDWNRCMASADASSCTVFLRRHRYSVHAPEAMRRQSLVKAEQNAAELSQAVGDGLVEAEARGAGIDYVVVKLRRLAATPLAVEVSPGTFFVARGNSQNMVACQQANLLLADGQMHELRVAVACANRTRPVPSKRDEFEIRAAPDDPHLTRVAASLARSDFPFPTRQAVVWVVTDDANYSDLRILVAPGGRSVIGPAHALTAMRICAEAGIDIRAKRIWQDRDELRRSVDDDNLRQWITKAEENSVN